MMLGTLVIMTGCDNGSAYPRPSLEIDADLELAIRQAYAERLSLNPNIDEEVTIEDVWIAFYYGTYSGTSVVMQRYKNHPVWQNYSDLFRVSERPSVQELNINTAMFTAPVQKDNGSVDLLLAFEVSGEVHLSFGHHSFTMSLVGHMVRLTEENSDIIYEAVVCDNPSITSVLKQHFVVFQADAGRMYRLEIFPVDRSNGSLVCVLRVFTTTQPDGMPFYRCPWMSGITRLLQFSQSKRLIV